MQERLLTQETWSEEERAKVEDEIRQHLADTDVEAQALAPILQKKSKTTTQWGLFVVWFTASIKAASWACGALAVTVFGLGPISALLSIALGNVLGGIFVYLTAAMGRNGVPQSMLMIPIFGRKGAKIPQFLLFITVLGWTVANTVFSTLLGNGILMRYLPGNMEGVVSVVVMLVLTALAVYTANKKFDIVVRWLKPVTYLMMVILVIMTVVVIRDVDWTATATVTGISFPIMIISAMGALGIGYLGTWAPFSSDFTRYVNSESKSEQRKTGFISALSGWLCCTWLLGVGALFAHLYGGIDPAIHIAESIPWLALPALFVVLVGSWSSLVVNYISCGIDLKGLGINISREKSTNICAGVVIVLALISFFGADIATLYFRFLLFMVIWMVPWVCIQAMDYFLVNKCDYSLRGIYGLDNTYEGYNVKGLVCMVLGFIASWFFSYTGDLMLFGVIPLYSPIMVTYFHYGDFSFFAGALVTCVFYYFMSVKPRLSGINPTKS